MSLPTTEPLRKAARAQKALDNAEKAADEKALARNQAIWQAQQAGATYPQIQAATGLSSGRVAQLLQRERERLNQEA